MEINKSADGNSIAKYMQESSTNAIKIGRHVMYALLAILWVLSYHEETLTDSLWLRWSLIFGIAHVCLDYLYYVCSALFYKKILKKYFEPEENGGMIYKEGVDRDEVDRKTKRWMDLGSWWIMVMTLMIALTAAFMIVHIVT